MEGQAQLPFPQINEICSTEFLLDPETAKSMVQMTQGSYAGIIQLADKYRPDLSPFLIQLNKEENVSDRLCEFVKPDQYSSFSCLCHGDPRLNNIFINKKNPDMVQFIDFQVTRYASPLTDILYVLYMGATRDLRHHHTNQVLQVYHEEFRRVIGAFPDLKMLPSKEDAVRNWTLEKMKEEYEEIALYGMLIAFPILPLILSRPDDIDKEIHEMGKEERDKFWENGRQQIVFDLGCKYEEVRTRLFDICDEAKKAYIEFRK